MEETLTCAVCSKKIDSLGAYTILKTSKSGKIETVLCPQCSEQFQDRPEQETLNPNYPIAFIAGIAGAAVAGIIWYYFVILTEIQFGLVAVLMGWLVGKSVVWGAGNKRGERLQYLSVSLTIIAIIFSEYLVLNHYFIEEFGSEYGNLTFDDFITAYGYYFSDASGFFNFIFYAIALWQAYKTPGKRELVTTIVNQPPSVSTGDSSGEDIEKNQTVEWEKSIEEKNRDLEERRKKGGYY